MLNIPKPRKRLRRNPPKKQQKTTSGNGSSISSRSGVDETHSSIDPAATRALFSDDRSTLESTRNEALSHDSQLPATSIADSLPERKPSFNRRVPAVRLPNLEHTVTPPDLTRI